MATSLLTLLLTVTAIIGMLYGVATLFTPEAYLELLGLEPSPSAVLQARYFGAAVLGAGVMLGMARRAQEPKVQAALALGNLLVVAGSAVVTTVGLAGGLLSAVGWGFLASELVLAVGYGYVLLKLK
ncbi:MAG: DUF4345 family protein [Caldilineales bacterium]|nr:DUF4345 family protein [Caldilineales bacterium]MDW8319108.1 DUF4345 family protein [Anaerolineae bacterium]